jgi:spore coat polysaccharide biosynthesis protein SpsF
MDLKLSDFVIVIQARMSSTRLPGKVLKETGFKGYTMLGFLLQRISALNNEGMEICVATSKDSSDDKIESFIDDKFKNVRLFRGDLNDVLSRYHECVLSISKKAVIRITSDCPFSDPILIKEMAEEFIRSDVDYMSNTMPPEESEFSDGFDVEIFTSNLLESCALDTSLTPSEREHVTFTMWQSGKYKTTVFGNKNKHTMAYKLSIDSNNDFELFQKVIRRIDLHDRFFEIEKTIHKNNFYLINADSLKNSGWKK